MLSSLPLKSVSLPYRFIAPAAVAALGLGAWLSSASPLSAAPGDPEQTIELTPRWTFAGWLGPDDFSIATALATNTGPAGDLSNAVTAIWYWDSTEQAWQSHFPGADDVPGANDFNTFDFQAAYSIAYNGDGPTQWIIPTP